MSCAFNLPFEQIKLHEEALVVPFRRRKRNQDGFDAGVFSVDGDVLPNTEMRTTTRWAAPKKSTCDDALEGAAYLKGEWLFCGIASAQFGHIITRGLGMLWAAQALPKDVNLLFVSMLYNQDDHPFLTEFLENAGIEKTYRILSEPAQIERLFTAPDLFSEAHKCVADREYAEWASNQFTPKFDKRRKRKLYITRGKLSPTLGRYLNEDLLETLLEHAGFEIVAPETMSVCDQLKLYAEADTIIASEGSALHLICMSLRETATLAVIQRRPKVPGVIENQVASFCNADVHYINVIDRVFWPKQRADNVSLVRLDFDQLRDTLVSLGVLAKTAEWRVPTKEEEHLSLHAGRSETEQFLSDKERLVFLKQLRRKRRARRQMLAAE
jgi:hypothetical protein